MASNSAAISRVVGGIDDHDNVSVILGRRANHRGSADIDILDRVFERDARLRDGLLKGIEVDDDQVDQLEAVLFDLRAMNRGGAARENAAVNLRMQRLDAALQNLPENR